MQVVDYGMTPETKRLAVIWTLRKETERDVQAALIQVATDSRMAETVRTFLVPANLGRIDLDVGRAGWFFRIGALIGTAQTGRVDWSDIYGPVPILSEKDCIPETVTDVALRFGVSELHGGGVRIVPNDYCGYLFVELTSKSLGEISYATTVWSYARIDSEHPAVDLYGLIYAAEKTYAARLYTMTDPVSDLTTRTVRKFVQCAVVEGLKPAMQMRSGDSGAYTTHAADAAIAAGRHQKFASHADYVRFMNARQKY